MTDESGIEPFSNLKHQKLASASESLKNQEEICVDQGRSKKFGANHPTKAAKSKREIMEELSRERFPWEE